MADLPESNNQARVEVCFSPNLYPLHDDEHKIVVVIDVLRATSAICAAFHNGVEKIIPVSTLTEALEYKKKGYEVAAERNGSVVEGFRFGNSPFSYMTPDVKGATIVLTTTNGTHAINVAKKSEKVVIGSLVNLDALTKWLIEQKQNTLMLCSGWQNRFNLEDTICAGALVDELIKSGDFRSEHDSTVAAKYLYLSARDNMFGYLKASSHRSRLRNLNLNEDIKYCLTPNQTDVIPILKGEELVLVD